MPTTQSLSDEKILRAVHTEGANGWNTFCARFDPLITSVINWPKWRFSEHEREDVRQNTYVQLQTALPAFRRQSSLSWFIKKITIRQCINEIRRQVRQRNMMIPAVGQTEDGSWCELQAASPDALDPHQEILKKERQQALHSAMHKTTNLCREVINMFYINHLTYREIASRLGISTNTVGSRLSKCLNALKRELRHHPVFERKRS